MSNKPSKTSNKSEAAVVGAFKEICDVAKMGGKSYAGVNKRDTHYTGINSGEYSLTYKDVDSDITNMIKQSVKMYFTVALIKNIVDLMGDFAAEGIQIVHKSKSVQEFYKKWAKKVRLTQRINTFLTEYYKSGNVFIWRVLGSLDILQQSIKIPIAYRAINPLAITIKGDEFLGTREFYLKTTSLGSSNSKTGDTEFAKNVSGDKNSKQIKLDSDRIYVMQYKKSDWNKWAQPMIYPTIYDVDFKNKLREMDRAAMDSLINAITLYKLGSDEHPATRKLFQKLAAIIKEGSASMNLIWDNNIDIEHIHLPVKDVLGAEKYNSINDEIMAGLGVPDIIVGGDGSNFSNSFLQIKTFVEKLKNGQELIVDFLEGETSYIADKLGFRLTPEIRIDRISLRDELQEKRIIMQLVDRGIMSMETALTYFGENMEIETERLQREIELERNGVIDKKSPFDKKDSTSGEPGQGRPDGTGVPQENPREELPEGFSNSNYLLDVFSKVLNKDKYVDDIIASKVIEYKENTGKNPGPNKLREIKASATSEFLDGLVKNIQNVARK